MMRLKQVGGFLIVALITGGGGASAQAAPAPGGAPAADKGAVVYVAQKCSLCHSLDGKGNAKGPLDGVGLKWSADEIRQWIVTPAEMGAKAQATRKPAMKAFASLPKEDLDALVAFLHAKKKK
ncbi:MAG: cytochrome c [Acidobacteriota bacterium]|nr:cytochrome c [Acidobacteriota bacterium]